MNPEEANALKERIFKLTSIGQQLLAETKYGRRRSYENRVKVWAAEVSAFVEASFNENSVLADWSGELKTRDQLDDSISGGIDLLETASNYIYVDSRGTASDPLKRLVDETLKENYFASWPFRGVLLAFGAMSAM